MEAQPEIQVFHPTMEEFKDMIGYIEKIESQGAHLAGLAKIVPPKEWKPIKDPNFFESEHFNNLDVESPIRQEFVGDQGTFLALNHLTKSMSVREFKKITNDVRYAPPREYFDFDDLERKFWANINIGQPLYGADISGSLSDADLELWNIANLPGVLNILKKEAGIPGVTTPYLYYGMWKAGFAWHTEDLDLYSINYLHHGAPKHWYAVPPKYGWKLEALARGECYSLHGGWRNFVMKHKCLKLLIINLSPFEESGRSEGGVYYRITSHDSQPGRALFYVLAIDIPHSHALIWFVYCIGNKNLMPMCEKM